MHPSTVPVSALQENLKTLESQREDGWAKRHLEAWRHPRPDEEALKSIIVGLAQYGTRHLDRYGSVIGEDGMLGVAYRDAMLSALTLLNGHLGRFDAGTLDALLRAIALENGVELDQ